jgi:hypothetical protein
MTVLGRAIGPGCSGQWLRLSVGGYLCSEEIDFTSKKPGGPRYPVVPKGRRLPYKYVLTGRFGGSEYANWEDAACDLPFRFLDPGFGRTVTRLVKREGLRFWRTTRGTYIPAEAVFRVRGSRLKGAAVGTKKPLPLVFTHRTARVYRRPGARSGRTLSRFRHFRVTGLASDRRGRTYYEIPDVGYVRTRAVRVALPHSPPYEVRGDGKWVDLDISQQVLVAYEGSKPVYATLMSSGRGDRTPTGTYRVWAKLAATTMDSPQEQENRYSMWDVPWTLYFKGGFALHGTYWHNRFGNRKSHGCINLSPRDAAHIFHWSDPQLPPGWWARLPKAKDPSLVVHIRKSTRKQRLAIFEPRPPDLPRLLVRSWPALISISP